MYPQVFSSWDGVLEYARSVILQASFASGIEVPVFSAEVPALGMPWLLVTLALGRILFDYLHFRMGQRKFVISCVVLSFIGVIVGKVQYLPLSFDIVLVLPLLLYIGGCLIRLAIEKAPFRKTIVYGGIWAAFTVGIYLLTDEYLEMARRSYPLYPVSMVGAVFGTLMTAEFSAFLVEKVKPISRPLVYIGENSLYLLYVHMFDVSFFGRLWNITEIQYINVFLRIVVDLAIFALLMVGRKGIRRLRERT